MKTKIILLVLVSISGCTTNTYRHEFIGNGGTNYASFSRNSFLTKQQIGKITIHTKDGSEVTIDGVSQDQVSGLKEIVSSAVTAAVKASKP